MFLHTPPVVHIREFLWGSHPEVSAQASGDEQFIYRRGAVCCHVAGDVSLLAGHCGPRASPAPGALSSQLSPSRREQSGASLCFDACALISSHGRHRPTLTGHVGFLFSRHVFASFCPLPFPAARKVVGIVQKALFSRAALLTQSPSSLSPAVSISCKQGHLL